MTPRMIPTQHTSRTRGTMFSKCGTGTAGNPLVDFQTLEAALATVAGVKLAPSPAPSPGRATLRNGGLPSAGK